MEMMREMAIVVIACLVFSLFEAFFVLPSHLASKKILSEEKVGQWPWYIGLLVMLAGLGLIFYGTGLIPENPTAATVLFPFAILILAIVMIFLGFNKSQIEGYTRKAADVMITFFKDYFIGTTVNFISSGKIYRLFVFFPLIFVIYGFWNLGSGRIGFTFFPNIEPDMFTIEVPNEQVKTNG